MTREIIRFDDVWKYYPRYGHLARGFKKFLFAELGEWIDEPIRAYSTGMVARLGFSVVAHLDLEILLIEEAWQSAMRGFSRTA